MFPLSKNHQAIAYMLAAMFCLSAMNVALRMISGENGLHSTQIVVFRHIWSIIIILIWAMCLKMQLSDFKSNRMKGHFWRATFGIMAMQLWFYSISIMSINLATALSFTTPIFSTILAIIFLGEKAGVRRWAAIITGFIGMLIILRPDVNGVSSSGWIVIAASLLMAGSGVMVKSLTSSESAETIVFYMSVFMLLWSVPVAISFWQPFTTYQLGVSFIVAFCSTAAHLFMARAFMRAELVKLMPLDFTRLVFTAILAYLFFGETIDSQTILGSAVIVASAVYIGHREAKKRG
jgi:drug/metabolite transporter (DMT)-like permease